MDNHQVVQLADRFIGELHRLEQGDAQGVEALADMFSDNAELTNSIIEADNAKAPRHGREEIAQFWREYGESFQGIHSDFFDVTANDHSAGLFWRSQGNDIHGKPLEYEGVSLLVFDDAGKIKHFRGYFNQAQIS